MSGIEMASNIKLSYRRLRNEGGFVDDDEYEPEQENSEEVKVNWRVRRWSRIRRAAGKKRPRIRIPGLRRFLRRRKEKVVSAVRISWSKFFRRMKVGRPYMSDLFAGNYLFMQVTPSTLRYDDKSYMGLGLHGYTSKRSLGKIA